MREREICWLNPNGKILPLWNVEKEIICFI